MPDKIDYRNDPDPECRRWGKKYPRFPGVAECVNLLRTRKARGTWLEIIHHELSTNAPQCLGEMIAAFKSEQDEWVRLMILMAIADAGLPEAIPFLADVVRMRHPEFSHYGEEGLQKIGTREARTALWEASHSEGSGSVEGRT